MVTAAWAQTLLDAATPGPWKMDHTAERDAIHIDAPRGEERIGHNYWDGFIVCYGNQCNPRAGDAVAHGNASLICAAHDLAQTVVELHAEVERLRALLEVTP